MREQGPARGGHATPMCPAVIATLSPASLAHKAAKTATARLWPRSRGDGLGDRAEAVSAALRAAAEARSRYSRCSQRFSASNCQFQCRFLRSSPLAAAAVIIVRPRAFLLQAAACRLSRAFMRRLQPRAATLTWPRVHATAGRHGLAGLVESVQVNVRIRGTGRK